MAAIPEPLHTTAALIDKWYEDHREQPRPHLGASLLGHPCERYLWLSFRWAVREQFSGRMLRLFERGHREEIAIVGWLRKIGVEIHHTDADGEQMHVDLAPHVGGSVDGIIESGVPEAPKCRHIAEFKTHNKRSFDELAHKGVYEAKRRHWCQMQCYMAGTGIDRALYVAVCKDDDRIYTERVEYQPEIAKEIIDRGARIALSEHIPPPLSTDPAWYQCKMCGCWSFCHETKLTQEVNCRTCAHSTPGKDGRWHCEFWRDALDVNAQLDGCASHVLHPDLVPWRFKGGAEQGRCAVYEIDGHDVLNGSSAMAILSKDLISGKRVPDPNQSGCPF